MRRVGRWLLVTLALLFLAGFGLARSLEPDPRGFGTHQRLGLPPCTTRALWNLPCPGCGMTTSFAHFTRGQLLPAMRANLAGVLLAIVCAAAIPWCLWSAWQGRMWRVEEPSQSLMWLLLALMGAALLEWGLRLLAP
ncbi:MAG: DUF2752 domain-containing protein [Planctomycetota bacterium]|nr:DUF2752 domain-containing protein [Planctomycetota bacterium]